MNRLFALASIVVFFAAGPVAHADNITDTGPGSFSDIDNTGTLDYILIKNGASSGNVINWGGGILNANTLPATINADCCGPSTFNIATDGSTVTGNVINNGAISQTNIGADNVAGILISNVSSIGGGVTNNGSITITGGDADEVDGVLVDDLASVTGSVVNNGAITATSGVGGFSTGLNTRGTIHGYVANNGAIILTSGAGGDAIGVNADGAIDGYVANSGTITLTSGEDATGIYTGGTIGGYVANSGTITATVGDNSLILGISSDASVAGDITNSGTITVTAGAGGTAYGVRDNGVTTGSLISSGSINATTGSSGYAYGLDNETAITGGIINSGMITVTATGVNGYAYGISNDNAVSGNMANTGTIVVNGGSGAGSSAVGMGNYGTLNGNLTNSGTLTTWAGHTAGTSSGAIVNYGTITGDIINTGTITATLGTDTPGWGIFSYGNSAVTINQNGGSITGDIGLSGRGDVFNINAGTVTDSIIGNVNGGNSSMADIVHLNGGTLALPANGYITAIGTYTQGDAGTLSVGVTPTTSATISAPGITLDGTLKIAPSGSGWTLNAVKTYTNFIHSTSTISGTFSTVTSISPLFTASVTPDGSDARSLTVTEVPAGFSPGVNSFIAGLLGNPGNTTAAQNLANGLESLTAPQLQTAINQLTGTSIAQTIQSLRGVSSDFNGVIEQRLLLGNSYDSSDLLSLHMAGQYVQVASLDTDTPFLAMSPSATGGTWMRAFGSFASGAAQGGVSAFDQDRSGVILGLDHKLGDNWTLGAAVQYAHTSLSFNDGSGTSDADSYNGIFYGGWHQDQLYVNGTAGFGWNNYGSDRSLVIGGFASNPSGSFSGQDYSASAETGYAFHADDDWAGKWLLTPYAGLDYTYIHTDAFTESGDGASNLSVQASHSNSLITTLGMRAGTRIETEESGTFLPEFHLGWEHEYLDQSQNINAAFVSSPGNSFSVTGAQYGRDSAIVGAGVAQQLSENSRIFITYDARLNGGYTEHAVSGGIRFEF